MGSVLTPSYVGIENALDLPQASTMCGECQVVCPMKIPLPDLLRKLRDKQLERGLRPLPERIAMAAWRFAAARPALYRPIVRIASRLLKLAGGERGRVAKLPLAGGWTDHRDLIVPSGPTFKERWLRRRSGG
jgi:L-lactate dehydrogenase complex protein LldF